MSRRRRDMVPAAGKPWRGSARQGLDLSAIPLAKRTMTLKATQMRALPKLRLRLLSPQRLH